MTSGIYQICHVESGKVYVGSSKQMEKRWAEHNLQMLRGTHHSTKLRNAVKKYGLAAFVIESLELCEQERLIEREKFWIDAKNAVDGGYNIRRQPDSNFGNVPSAEARARMSTARMGREVTLETRARMSATKRGIVPTIAVAASATARKGRALSVETRAKLSAAHRGKVKTPEHIAKVAAKLVGRLISEETRKRISEGQKGRKLTPEQLAARMGRKMSAEAVEKRVAKMRGVPQSPEHIAKRAAATKATKAANAALRLACSRRPPILQSD